MTAMTARRGIISAGRIYCDLVFTGVPGMPQLGQEIFAEGMTPVLGGGAFIAAAHLAARGRPAALLSRFGTDALSRGMEAGLLHAGLELGFVERHAAAGPQVTVVMASQGDRAFLSRRAGQALPDRYAEALHWPQATHLHIAEYATLVEHPELVALARKAGLTISLDPSWDETLIGDPALLAGAGGVDVFLPNAEEAMAMTGCSEIGAAQDRLAEHFPLVAIKDGAQGASLAQGASRLSQGAPRVPVVDTTGAGDAFNAGFLDSWLDGLPVAVCLAQAIAAGSASVQAAGGATMLADQGLRERAG